MIFLFWMWGEQGKVHNWVESNRKCGWWQQVWVVAWQQSKKQFNTTNYPSKLLLFCSVFKFDVLCCVCALSTTQVQARFKTFIFPAVLFVLTAWHGLQLSSHKISPGKFSEETCLSLRLKLYSAVWWSALCSTYGIVFLFSCYVLWVFKIVNNQKSPVVHKSVKSHINGSTTSCERQILIIFFFFFFFFCTKALFVKRISQDINPQQQRIEDTTHLTCQHLQNFSGKERLSLVNWHWFCFFLIPKTYTCSRSSSNATVHVT